MVRLRRKSIEKVQACKRRILNKTCQQLYLDVNWKIILKFLKVLFLTYYLLVSNLTLCLSIFLMMGFLIYWGI